jgi:ABC-type Fe3+ transport system permease subunit
VLGGVLFLALSFAYAVQSEGSDTEKTRRALKAIAKWLKVNGAVVIVAVILCVILPSKQTILLIAASEVGERVLSNEKVTSIIDPSVEYLQAWIKNELGKLKADKK